MYLRWRRQLPAWIRVKPMELPGRGVRFGESFVLDFQIMIDLLCNQLAGISERPWALFGHSMGALLAFGITQRLQSIRAPLPEILLVSGSPAPSRRDPDCFPDVDDEAALIANLRQRGGTPREVFDSSELLRMTLDTLSADYRVCESFRYQQTEPLSVPIEVFAGRDDDIEIDRMEAWRTETNNAFSLHWFDGGHFFIHQYEEQVLRMLDRTLRKTLKQNHHSGAVDALPY